MRSEEGNTYMMLFRPNKGKVDIGSCQGAKVSETQS